MTTEYINYFSWTSRIDDIFQKIEDLYTEIKIDHSNYRQIFDHLDQYIKIDDVILNTENHPFLKFAAQGAKNLPDHDFKIIFSELLTKNDLIKYNLCDAQNNCEISKIRQEIFDGLSKFFKKSENDLDLALTENNPDYNHNLNFVNYENVLDKVLEKFIEFNQNSENSQELIEKFQSIIEKYKNLECQVYLMAFKLDLAKILSIFDSDQNVLAHDFDQIKYFDIEIDEEYNDFPKFSLAKFDYIDNKPFVPLICTGGINYLPKNLEKIYLVFFEHTVNHLNDQFINFNGGLIYTETKFEILFEYINSKNFQTNKEIKDFFEKIEYQDLYKEFDEFYQNHTKKSSESIINDYNKAHFFSGPIEKMHLIDNSSNEILHHFWFKPKTKEDQNSGTWHKSAKEIEKLSQKNDIFEQIKTGLGFL